MGIGASVFLLAVGAILAFAVNYTVSGVDINVIGAILMVAGAIGLLMTSLVFGRRAGLGDAVDTAVLDVTDPEPIAPDSPLWSLPNVMLTPHIAGASGNELLRLGAAAVAQVEEFAANGTLQRSISREAFETIA